MNEMKIPAVIKKDRIAVAIWKRTIPELLKIQRTEPLDEAILTNYCVAYASALRSEAIVKEVGATQTVKGYVSERPEESQRRAAWKEMRACSDRLGLNPSSRRKMDGADESTDPFFN